MGGVERDRSPRDRHTPPERRLVTQTQQGKDRDGDEQRQEPFGPRDCPGEQRRRQRGPDGRRPERPAERGVG